MGLYDTLIDGEKQAQIKCFNREMNTYKVGDQVPRDGSFIIVLPPQENKRFAFIKDGVFIGLTDRCPVIIDKWGRELTSFSDFRNPFEDLVQDLDSAPKMEMEK